MTEFRRVPIRWWPALLILAVGAAAFYIVRSIEVWPYEQARNIAMIIVTFCTVLAMLVWWLVFSRVRLRTRFLGLLLLIAPFFVFRLRGMTGDFLPIFELRFGGKKTALATSASPIQDNRERAAYPQLFGPTRDARLPAVHLNEEIAKNPPEVVWRIPVGAAWSGFVIEGNRAFTQEQDGENECVSCYELATGKQLWKTANPARYESPIAGIGPRATPTIHQGRLYTLGALGLLQCLDVSSGKVIWSRDLKSDSAANVPEWGFASSPLIYEDKVLVSAGGTKSLFAYRISNGEIAWSGGTRPINYSSPFFYDIAGRSQIIMFNKEAITAHDPASGAVLWEYPWGKGLPHVARPILVGDKRLFFSSGYGVGSALLELTAESNGAFKVDEVWKTTRYQAKFATPIERDGYVYGVSDGIFACLDLKDGSVKWKEGRYGHGQALMLGDYLVQMTEQPGDLVFTKPTPEGPHELGRFPLFEAKTWNPIAVSGELLLVRNDQEAACVRLPLVSRR